MIKSLLFLIFTFSASNNAYSGQIQGRNSRAFGKFTVVSTANLKLSCNNKYRKLKVPGYCLLTLEEQNSSKKRRSVISTGESCRWQNGRTVEADIGIPFNCLVGAFMCTGNETVYHASSLENLHSLFFGKWFMNGYRFDGKKTHRVFKYYDRASKKFVINSDPKIVEARERYAIPTR